VSRLVHVAEQQASFSIESSIDTFRSAAPYTSRIIIMLVVLNLCFARLFFPFTVLLGVESGSSKTTRIHKGKGRESEREISLSSRQC